MEITATNGAIRIDYTTDNTKTIFTNMVSDLSYKDNNIIFRYEKENHMYKIPYEDIKKYNGSTTVPAIDDLYTSLLGYVNDTVSTAASTALAASLIIKDTPGTLFSLSVYNDKGSAQYIQLHDSATVPADTAVPVFVFQVATKTTQVINLADLGMSFATGIVVCNSSTAATKTIGSADCWFTANYK